MNRSDTKNTLTQCFYTAQSKMSKMGEDVQGLRLPKEGIAEITVTT